MTILTLKIPFLVGFFFRKDGTDLFLLLWVSIAILPGNNGRDSLQYWRALTGEKESRLAGAPAWRNSGPLACDLPHQQQRQPRPHVSCTLAADGGPWRLIPLLVRAGVLPTPPEGQGAKIAQQRPWKSRRTTICKWTRSLHAKSKQNDC